MEQESQAPMLGMLGCDRDTFARVWARVSPVEREGCPIQVLPPEGTTLSTPVPAPVSTLTPAPAPPRPQADCLGNDDPHPGDVPCLGLSASDHNTLLQAYIRHELLDWRTYQALARRAGGTSARTLAAIAADEHRHAKRLSGAYFLISGIRFFPDTPMPKPGGSLMGAIRERFWEEQHGAAAYLAAAEETADQCLAALYRELAAEEAAHADLLRALVERM